MYREKYIILFIFIILVNFSCVRYSSEIEEVLNLAGNNRKELEKVLKHYGKNPADSLKLRAAEFLIANMPGKYSEYDDVPWNDAATVYLRWTSSSDKQLVLDTYQLGDPVKKDDVTHITAEYLINNIDLAFQVWKEMPWGKHIPFDAFCEEILPYRVSTEPPENWREKVLASFADLYKSFREDTTITSIEACSHVNDKLPRFRMDKDFPPMSFSQLMATTRGMCDNQAALTIFVMRALGIPVTIDFTPMWFYSSVGHSWNSVRDSSGLYYPFQGTETNPEGHNTGHAVRIYRQLYGKQQNADQAVIPPLLHNINYIRDVTSEYGYGIDLWFLIPKDHSNEKGHIYLSILNGMEWNPVVSGIFTTSSIEFHSMRNGLYLPVYYRKGVQTPIGYPFRLQTGTYTFYQPLSSQTGSFTGIAPGNDDGDGIYEGDVYELFYWNWDKWSSLGRKTSTGRILQYDVPDNALLFLKNVTKNKMHRTPFTIEGGVQQWF